MNGEHVFVYVFSIKIPIVTWVLSGKKIRCNRAGKGKQSLMPTNRDNWGRYGHFYIKLKLRQGIFLCKKLIYSLLPQAMWPRPPCLIALTGLFSEHFFWQTPYLIETNEFGFFSKTDFEQTK
jgi:hypothetical protein